MNQRAHGRSPSFPAVGTAAEICVWLAVVFVAGPRFGLYYEALAAWLVLPPLGLVYAHCLTRRRRASAALAVIATAAAAFVVALSFVMPHASAA